MNVLGCASGWVWRAVCCQWCLYWEDLQQLAVVVVLPRCLQELTSVLPLKNATSIHKEEAGFSLLFEIVLVLTLSQEEW